MTGRTGRLAASGLLCALLLAAADATARQEGARQQFTLANEKVTCTVAVAADSLTGDTLRLTGSAAAAATDADFALEVMYTDWSAPGKVNNAENPVRFTKKDFRFAGRTERDSGGVKRLDLFFKARESTIDLRLSYTLDPGVFYVRRSLAVMDTAFGHHFLQWVWPRSGAVSGVRSVVKAGGFGQPVAFLMQEGGAFFGLEYPTAENHAEASAAGVYTLRCGQEMGELIGSAWVESETAVEGITPDDFVKLWFFRYVDAIRVAPLRPFTLYNSWYDLRSPEYPKVPQEHWMSETSALKMAKLLRENMIEKHNIRLDAFVLDDGWDTYESDWMLRKEQWPNGLKPLADELKKTNTALGMWIGPTGGYSFRMRRVTWMKVHGYEVVGTSRDNAMLCLAGTHYAKLFRKRVTDFVQNDGVGYFKWDGIQFSCSEPDHGHPVGIYSRRAVMQSLIGQCRAVRENHPDVFLNITSGTWLSPWWVKYANTIWMQGSDYGFSDVPSISKRDGAITYRDFILYDDFTNLDLWFPIQNLMTHGIIKGKLESTGSPDEPLDKFTDDALLYCARGVTMYELYISPDILTEGEWNTLAASLTWARDRFPVLSSTFMIGGDPMKRQPYAYVHFKGSRGIVAARNPFITPGTLGVDLAAAYGLDPNASWLVVEKVYPTRWIAPRFYKAGDTLTLPLDGYETALYEISPVSEADVPLLAGVTFDVDREEGNDYRIRYHSASAGARILNPEIVSSMSAGGTEADPDEFVFPAETPAAPVTHTSVIGGAAAVEVGLDVAPGVSRATVALLLTPDSGLTSRRKPGVAVRIDGSEGTVRQEDQEGKSQWYQVDVAPGAHRLTFTVVPGKEEKRWSGRASVWLICQQRETTHELSFTVGQKIAERPMPPHPWNPGEMRRTVRLGEAAVTASSGK